ncbi:hypothetical protein PV396_43125 [Streptomyces sp. ME02-8801-2C]|uniref:hypothetical protein n=1 Tax=Streptomyces sp. ME02-8801-2C TaxID=3028680 RepID=UPI0029BC631F|nr:hypothetical protein [Streptomyces sp. ME02-8801-2C]MDX3458644.1 hypothetical protein [Streptomyces sp. ME02-8801-2C]
MPRVLALAVLLFGVLFAHGVHAEGIKGHLSTSATAALADPAETGHQATEERTALPVVATDGQPDGHGSPHPAEHCASGQPQQGTTMMSPCFALSVREPASPGLSALKAGLTGVELRTASAAAMRASVVQQV